MNTLKKDLSAMNETENMLPASKGHILVVDDDVASCRTLQLHLRSEGYKVSMAHSVDKGLAAAHAQCPNLLILDIRMPGKSGLEGLPEFKQAFPALHVIMITAFHDMDSTIQAMRQGAEDYIHKPIDINELDKSITQILIPDAQPMLETEYSKPVADTNTMVGRSRAMKEVFKTIGLVTSSPVTVLITGESGTGKELVARAIHRAGQRSKGPFVAINCAALVETLLESDMFGHEKGSFTGAVARQQGKFELANHGSIFLDEIGELSLTMQAKLLRVLQEKEFTPIGAKTPLRTDARIIAATNVDLAERVRNGQFREDLYYRLRVVTIHLPPLRERREDIDDLVQALMARINQQINSNITQISTDVMKCLNEYDWPGNVRELSNTLEKAMALCPGTLITRNLIADICNCDLLSGEVEDRSLAEMSLEEIEGAHVKRVLDANHWHKGRACATLGVSRPRLRRMIKHFELTPPDGTSRHLKEDDEHGEENDTNHN